MRVKPGMVVEYQNDDFDYKRAIVTLNVAGQYCDAITFSGREIHLKLHDGPIPARASGKICTVIANNLDEFLALS